MIGGAVAPTGTKSGVELMIVPQLVAESTAEGDKPLRFHDGIRLSDQT